MKRTVQSLQETVNSAKRRYRNALQNLEAISEEIHKARQKEDGQVQELLREAVESAPSPEAYPDGIGAGGSAETSPLDLALAGSVGDVLASMTKLSYSCSSLNSSSTLEVRRADWPQNGCGTQIVLFCFFTCSSVPCLSFSHSCPK